MFKLSFHRVPVSKLSKYVFLWRAELWIILPAGSVTHTLLCASGGWVCFTAFLEYANLKTYLWAPSSFQVSGLNCLLIKPQTIQRLCFQIPALQKLSDKIVS